jgi:capsular polysaccharide biosynthesis protein
VNQLVSIGRKLANFLAWKALGLTSRSSRPAVIHRRQVTTWLGAEELVLRTASPAVIEPELGFPIVEPRLLCMQSFDALRGPLPPWTYGIPSALAWVSPTQRRARPMVELDRVVSLRHLFEWNYYHFMADVLGKLALFARLGMLDNLPPIVMGPSANEAPFVKELMEMGDFAGMNWVVQEHGSFIRAQEITFGRAGLSHAETARFVVDRMNLQPLGANEPERKVFLVRRPPTTRCIVNFDEIEAVTAAAGFETVDTTGWPLRDQVELFRRTKALVAIHGAGMANMMFRVGSPMNVVELCSDGWSPVMFQKAAEELGFGYRRLIYPAETGASGQHADFRVDAAQLAATLAAL